MLVRLFFVVMHWVMVTRELLFWSVNNKNKFENLSLTDFILSCDKYLHCQDGADLKTCGNGLGVDSWTLTKPSPRSSVQSFGSDRFQPTHAPTITTTTEPPKPTGLPGPLKAAPGPYGEEYYYYYDDDEAAESE
jgi:hypothetical protein